MADDITIPPGTTVTTTQAIDQVGDTATVEAGGAIDVTGLNIPGILATADDQTVINNGAIIASGGSDSEGIFSNGTVGTPIENAFIINNGTITTERRAIELEYSINGTVINNGVINADSDGIIGEDNSDNTVVINNGTINASNDGIEVNDPGSLVVNNGTITTSGDPFTSNGFEINSEMVSVINGGTIIAAGNAIEINFNNVTVSLLAGSVLDGGFFSRGSGTTLNIGSGLNLLSRLYLGRHRQSGSGKFRDPHRP